MVDFEENESSPANAFAGMLWLAVVAVQHALIHINTSIDAL